MSRIGKQSISLPEKVTFSRADEVVTIKGPLGVISRSLPASILIVAEGQTLEARPAKDREDLKALWGTVGAHLRNMVRGVTEGFRKNLIIEGVGYRATLAGNKLTFNLGLSHPIDLPIPEGLKVTVDKGNLTVSGIDKDLVGQFSAKIRELKPPEPYKGKGIRYDNEVIRRKEGKRVAA